MLLRQLKDTNGENALILELGRKIFREDDEIPLLRKALAQYVPELSYAAIVDENIVGFVLVCKKMTECYYKFMKSIPNCYEIAFLGISPDYQGYGIGSRLLKESLIAIFQISYTGACWLLVDTSNTVAIKLYKGMGFKIWRKADKGKTPVPGYILGLNRHRYGLR